MTAREQLFGPPAVPTGGSPQLSPVYQSEAAREIVEEMARSSATNRRPVPKEKRRHHTVSNIRFDAAERVVCLIVFLPFRVVLVSSQLDCCIFYISLLSASLVNLKKSFSLKFHCLCICFLHFRFVAFVIYCTIQHLADT